MSSAQEAVAFQLAGKGGIPDNGQRAPADSDSCTPGRDYSPESLAPGAQGLPCCSGQRCLCTHDRSCQQSQRRNDASQHAGTGRSAAERSRTAWRIYAPTNPADASRWCQSRHLFSLWWTCSVNGNQSGSAYPVLRMCDLSTCPFSSSPLHQPFFFNFVFVLPVAYLVLPFF